MLNMINFFRRSIHLLVFYFYIHGFQRVWRCDCFQFWERSLVLWVWKGEYLLFLKSVQDIRLPRSPSRLLNKGWASAQGKEAGGGSRRGKALGTGHRKRKRGGVGGGYIITFNLEGIRKMFTFVRK